MRVLLRMINQIIRLLEDSAKEVRNAAIETLEKFYAHIGHSLLVRATVLTYSVVVLVLTSCVICAVSRSAIWSPRTFAART